MKNKERYLVGGSSERVGEAYGFFYYKGNTLNISKELPWIKKATETPENLSLYLVRGVSNLRTQGHPGLVKIVRKAEQAKMNHVLQATLPGEGNRRGANFLGNIMNGIRISCYDKEEPFSAGVVYRRGSQYVFRRD